MLSVNKAMKRRVGGPGGQGIDGCPGLKLIAPFVQQDSPIEAFDNKEANLSVAALTVEALAGI